MKVYVITKDAAGTLTEFLMTDADIKTGTINVVKPGEAGSGKLEDGTPAGGNSFEVITETPKNSFASNLAHFYEGQEYTLTLSAKSGGGYEQYFTEVVIKDQDGKSYQLINGEVFKLQDNEPTETVDDPSSLLKNVFEYKTIGDAVIGNGTAGGEVSDKCRRSRKLLKLILPDPS